MIGVDDGTGFRAATTAEVDAALRQRELFGAVESPVKRARISEPNRFMVLWQNSGCAGNLVAKSGATAESAAKRPLYSSCRIEAPARSRFTAGSHSQVTYDSTAFRGRSG